MTFKNITALRHAIDMKIIDEENLYIAVDNDEVHFVEKDTGKKHNVLTACGYRDVLELYKIVFSKASVDWV